MVDPLISVGACVRTSPMLAVSEWHRVVQPGLRAVGGPAWDLHRLAYRTRSVTSPVPGTRARREVGVPGGERVCGLMVCPRQH